MAQHFLQSHHLYLTPLSPLHLGTGEDYQPTEYVMDKGAMYVFDPAQAVLNKAQYDELMGVAQRGIFIEIQKYFKKHATTFQNCAYKAIGVSKALENEYTKKLGETVQREAKGRNVHNQLTIERTAINPHTHQPYIAGSAFKGSIRTALLDALTKQNPPQKTPNSRDASRYENDTLGSFASDIMRLLKTADFMPQNTVATQIQYAVNHKKRAIIKDGQIQMPRGVTGRRETIQHGQYRSFQADCTVQHLCLAHQPHIKQPERNLPKENLRPIDIQKLAIAVNTYHLPRWEQENNILETRNLVQPAWLKHTRQLIADLQPQLKTGRVMLMRLGKNGGAESKTLTNLAQIKIMQGKGQPANFESSTKTVWLAAQSDKETHGLLPFGWVLIEIDPQSDNNALKQWCLNNSSHLTDTAQINADLAQRRQQNAERKQAHRQEQQRLAQEQQAAEEAEQRKAAEQAAALAAMTPAERLITTWQQQLKNFQFDSRNQQASSEFYQNFCQALQQASEQSFDANTQKTIAEAFAWSKISKQQPNLFSGKREKEIKTILRQLRGE